MVFGAEAQPQPIIVKHNKKHKHKHHSTAWKIALADFMTTLMILFFILWILALTPPDKKKALVSYFHGHFDASQNGLLPNKSEAEESANKLGRLYISLESELESVKHIIHVNLSRGRLELNLQSNVLFSSASANVNPIYKILLAKIATIVKDSDIYLDVYGYTDNLPIRPGNLYDNNLNLSIARAQSVAKEMITNGVALDRVGVHGEGERFPIASNSTKEGRSNNRRIVIYISPERSQAWQDSEKIKEKLEEQGVASKNVAADNIHIAN